MTPSLFHKLLVAHKLRIGIAGVGYVGEAIRHYLNVKKITPLLYDKGKHIGSMDILNKADIIFLCLPTPFEEPKGHDDSAIWEVADGIEEKKYVVIKSTVLPGTTESLQKHYPQNTFFFNPEFLRARSARKDFAHPERQIIGYTKKSKPFAKILFELLPQAPYKALLPSREAEMVKYVGNAFLAMRVVFANQMYDLCGSSKINYGRVMRAIGEDRRIGKSHFDVLYEGYRGYKGNCLPKDIRALLQFASKQGVELKLLETIEAINNKLVKSDETS